MRFFRVNDQNPLTGKHMMAIVGVFFGTIIAVNAVMAFLAVKSFPGLIVKNSYVASQNYNELAEEARAQAARGWRDELSVRDGHLVVRLVDAAERPLDDLTVTVRAGRPASMREDRIMRLAPHGGAYGSAAALDKGRWLVELTAHEGGRLVYRRTGELLVPGAAP